jgi:hypothetical protein
MCPRLSEIGRWGSPRRGLKHRYGNAVLSIHLNHMNYLIIRMGCPSKAGVDMSLDGLSIGKMNPEDGFAQLGDFQPILSMQIK